MGSSSDDFTALQTLLRVKRYEQPPPRYFDDLPQGILRRLRGPEGLRHKSLFSLLGLNFGFRPALFYGLSVACCVMALYAVIYILIHEPSSTTIPISSLADSSPAVSHLLNPDPNAGATSSSTNPILSSESVSFQVDGFKLRPTPVLYEPR